MARRRDREDDEVGEPLAELDQDLVGVINELRHRLAIAEGKLRYVQILLEGDGVRGRRITAKTVAREIERCRILPPHKG